VDPTVDLVAGGVVDVIERGAAQVGERVAAGSNDLGLDRLQRPAGGDLSQTSQVVLDGELVDHVEDPAAGLSHDGAAIPVIETGRAVEREPGVGTERDDLLQTTRSGERN